MGPDANIGATIGGYRIESLIGRGGMGAVYLAEHAHLERKVALKVLAPELAGDEAFRQRFIRESRLAAKLYHPNVIPIYDAGEADGLLYIAMHHVEGADLGARLRERGRLDAGYALFLEERVGGALDEAHASGLVHRDVKPGNIMIGPGEGDRQQVFLTDFGLVKSMDSRSHLTQTGYFVGTLDYAAPEMLRGEEVDGGVDIYALGCLLYECLTGEVPFPRDTQAALITAHLFDPPPAVTEKRPELPAGLDAVVARAMEKERDARYKTCGELTSAARGVLGGSIQGLPLAPPPPASLRPTPLGVPASPPKAAPGKRRLLRPRNVAVAGVLAVALGVGLFFLLRGGGTAAPPVTTISLGAKPFGIAVGEGSAWVAATTQVLRIEPSTNRVAARIRAGRQVLSVATGERAVWAVDAAQGSVARIDPTGAQPVRQIGVGPNPIGVAVGEGFVWVADNGNDSVSKIDPLKNTVVDTIHVGSEPFGAAVGFGAIWVTNGADGTVSIIDPHNDQVEGEVSVGSQPGFVAAGEGFVWVANQGDNSVSKIDPGKKKVVDTIRPGGLVAAGEGFLWIVNPDGTELSELDPATDRVVRTVQVGRGPFGVATGESSVWVVNQDDRTVSRVGL